MNKLLWVLRDRRGESMVEILVSTVVFMLLLGALNGAVGFAANAQRKAEQIRQDATALQQSVRSEPPSDNETETYAFHYTNGTQSSTTIDFSITLKKQVVNAKTKDGTTVPFYRFAYKGDTP